MSKLDVSGVMAVVWLHVPVGTSRHGLVSFQVSVTWPVTPCQINCLCHSTFISHDIFCMEVVFPEGGLLSLCVRACVHVCVCVCMQVQYAYLCTTAW